MLDFCKKKKKKGATWATSTRATEPTCNQTQRGSSITSAEM